MAKNYNPFKMWGSYVGAMAVIVIDAIRVSFYYNGYFHMSRNFVIPLLPVGYFYTLNLENILAIMIILFSYGFLLGWGIHSLCRRFSR